MKRLATILFALIGFYSFGQVTYIGSATSAQIGGLNVPSGRSALVYDSTLGQYGFENSASTWFRLITSQDIDTYAEFNAIVGDVTITHNGLIDTYSELNTIVSDVTLTHNGLIDTFAELDAIVSDKALGDVVGPVSSTDNALVRFDSTTGRLVQNSGTTLSDGGILSVPTSILIAGATVPTVSSTSTLTNKTISGASNTITNIGNSAIAVGAVNSSSVQDGALDETDLDASVNASLDLADSAVQENDSPTFNSTQSTTFLINELAGFVSFPLAYIGGVDGTSSQRWLAAKTGDDLRFSYQNTPELAGNSGSYTTIATINSTGTPANATDLIDKAYADANYGGGSGDVVGPASATDNAIARFDGTTGKLVQNSGVTIDDSGNITATGNVSADSLISTSQFPANKIQLIDAGGYYATDDLETAMQQLGGGVTVADGDYGDITVASGVWSVDSGAIASGEVTYDNTTSGLTATDVKAAIDELAGGSISDSGQGLSAATKSTGAELTYTDSDITVSGGATAKRKWNRHTANNTVILGTDITIESQPWLETVWGADSLYIKKGTNANFYIPDSTAALVSDGLILKGRETASVVGVANGADMDFYIVCNCTTHIEGAGCTADPNERATTANASSDPNCNEANSTSGWAAIRSTLSVETTDVDTGTYAIKGTADATSAGTSYIYYTVAITSGDTFTITYRYKRIGSTSTSKGTPTGTTGGSFVSPIPTTWTSVTDNVTATTTGNMLIQIFLDNTASASGDGNVVLIDNFSVVKTN